MTVRGVLGRHVITQDLAEQEVSHEPYRLKMFVRGVETFTSTYCVLPHWLCGIFASRLFQRLLHKCI